MKCPNCGQEMEIPEFYEDYQDNDTELLLTENHWCPKCDTIIIHKAQYRLIKEWTE